MINYKLTPGRKIKETGMLKNKEKTVISIITPFYNGGKTLMETANTVFSQTYPFFEWIIVDDGSKDEYSLKKLEELEKMDNRIKIYHKKNEGPSIARDYGISKSSNESKYIFFLDCDDMMENTMLECLYWTLETHEDASFAYTAMTNFGDKEFIWERYLTTEIEKQENVICISSMIKKEDLLEVGGFGIKEKSMYEDWNLWLKLLAAGKKPIRINAPLFWYRISSTGEFSRAKENHQKAMKFINETSKLITQDVEIIQFPSSGTKHSKITFHNNMILPMFKKNNKKNILFLIPWMTTGGADVFNIELIKRLNKEKYNIIVITTLPKENELRQEFYENCSECYDLSTFLERNDYLEFIDYIIKSRNIDIIFNSNSTYGYAALPFIRAKYKKVSIVDYIHSVDLKDPRGGFGRYTEDFDYFIDKTYTCNNFTTTQLKTDFNKKDVETIYIGTDHKRFDNQNIDKTNLRKKYNISDNVILITFIARLSEEKRPELFVRIAEKLIKENSNVHFAIAGDGPLKNDVKKEIKKRRLKDNVTMLGLIDSNINEEIYGMSDITVNCSSLEGLALTSYESLSMGVPVVSSNVGGQSELIDNTVGRIVPYKNNQPEEELDNYVKAIEEVINNLAYLKNNARKKILKGFTLEKMTEKFEKIFDNIKSQESEINEKLAINIYELYLDLLYPDYDWFCNGYNSKFGTICASKNNTNGIKNKLKRKLINISNKFGILNESKVILYFLRSIFTIARDIKWLILHILYMIKYLFKSILASIKILIKIIKKKC